MPHSTKRSTDSQRTFDLSVDDDRPMASDPKRSSAYGIALTSTPSHDERAELPSQASQTEKRHRNRRKSAPGTQTYAKVIENAGGNVEEAMLQRQIADRNSMRSFSYNDASKRRSQYYEDQFQYKDGAVGHTREKVQRQSPVIAELKTNVIIKDEFTLVTDLSQHLAQRYTRPQDCIMIRVDHSACLALGGNFEPCYILTINTVPSQMGQSTNKRNAALIQHFMADILSVPAERGIVTFIPIPEENLAQNGNTMLGEAERLEKQSDPNGIKKSVADAARKSMTFNKKSTGMLNGDTKSNGILAESASTQSTTPPTGSVAGTSQPNSRPGTASNKNDRPSTAGGTFAAENGLRMNGISTEQLVGKESRTPNGRPKTFGAPEPVSIQESILKKESVPSLPNFTTTPRTSKSDAKPNGSVSKSTIINHVPLAPRPAHQPSKSSTTAPTQKSSIKPPESRLKNTYLDNVSSLSNSKGTEPSIIITNSDEDIPLSKIVSANTSQKRRSNTITATPKLPREGHPQPPPVPTEDTKSMSSRLSKRKSFLRMFKRNSVPAWYEQ